MPYSEFSHVIDWVEAMEQCGDDEDFLRELLSDLRGEIDAQIVRMDEVLQVRLLTGKLIRCIVARFRIEYLVSYGAIIPAN